MTLDDVKVGDEVTVVIRYNSPVLKSLFPDVPNTLTFKGKVIPKGTADDVDTFRMTSDDPMVEVRVIYANSIVSVNGVAFGGKAEVKNERKLTVEGSKGKTYTITVSSDGKATCSCPGFGFRRTCKHLEQVKPS